MFHYTAAAILIALAATARAADLPDPKLTPGVTNPRLVTATICAMTFTTRDERHVTEAMKRAVYAAYGVDRHKRPCPCEVDHLISLEIGGANDLRNLWPQSYITKPWNAHVKDTLENRLHHIVCSGAHGLAEVQHDIASNWIAAYRKYIGGKPMASRERTRRH